jgi:hypothetical protein
MPQVVAVVLKVELLELEFLVLVGMVPMVEMAQMGQMVEVVVLVVEDFYFLLGLLELAATAALEWSSSKSLTPRLLHLLVA